MKPLSLTVTFISVMMFQMGMARDLPEILNSGVLRIGTTGDYAPLTLCNKQGRCEGFAIDMAQSLGKYLSKLSGKTITVAFVPTHWPDLHNDLKNDEFDIAMGGITRTEDRDARFLLSDPVIPSGKVALMQKSLASAYAGLNDLQLVKKLSNSNLHLVINPGGTNQQFTMKYLQDMRYTLTADNREPFLMLRDHQADLMITDRTEALHQIKQIPSLVIINDAMFSWTVSSKVYMSQKNSKLLISEVNRWLKTIDIQSMQERWL